MMSLPPVHPALIHLAVAFVLLSFVADVSGRRWRSRRLAAVGAWSLWLGTATAGIGIAAGYSDMGRVALAHPTESLVDLHVVIGWVLGVFLLALSVWRWRIRQQARRVVTRPYFFAALLGAAFTTFQTWYGAELVFSHGAGVAAAGQGIQPAQQAQRRLARIRELFAPDTGVGGVGGGGSTEQGRDGERRD
jgi:uncharacterized membrane protein